MIKYERMQDIGNKLNHALIMKYQLFFKAFGGKINALLVTAALVTGAATTYIALHFSPATQRSAPTSLQKKPRVIGVAALGYLEPQGEVIELSAPAFIEGARVEKLLVKQGDKVKAGQAIAILDSRDRLAAALAQAQQQVKNAQARLTQVKAGAKQGEILAQDAKFQGSQAELEGQISTQRATIANLEAQLQGEKSAQEATIERLKAELNNAVIDCQRSQSLFKDGAVSEQSRDADCLQEETKQKLLQEAQATLKRIVTSRSKQIQEAKANFVRTVATEQRQIQAAKATLNAIAEVRPVDVQVAQTNLGMAKAAVQKAQADLALAYVRSPQDGQILKIYTRPGELISDRGILSLGQTSQMYVTAEVYETDISRVRRGQRATMTAQGVIGDFHGTVDVIGLQIDKKDVLDTDPIADADARVVEVKIRLDSQDNQQVAGFTNLKVNVIINPTNLKKNPLH